MKEGFSHFTDFLSSEDVADGGSDVEAPTAMFFAQEVEGTELQSSANEQAITVESSSEITKEASSLDLESIFNEMDVQNQSKAPDIWQINQNTIVRDTQYS